MLGTEITQNAMFGSLITGPTGDFVSPYMFDSNNERGAINSMFIRNINFNQARGGTLTLGGVANGNGFGQILDGSGGTVVTMGSAGINVYGGNINIYDSAGGTVIDSLGLNSVSNFYNDRVTGGTFNTTSTVPANIPGGTLSSLVLTRDTNILIYVSINGRNFDADSALGVVVYDTYSSGTVTNLIANAKGNTDFYYDGDGHITTSFVYNQLATVVRNITFPAGTHTLNLQSYIRLGTAGTASLAGWELGIVKLGK